MKDKKQLIINKPDIIRPLSAQPFIVITRLFDKF